MNKRIDYIDLAKGICIIMVVFLHCTSDGCGFPLLEKKMCTFRMPLYFILSGLFFKLYNGFFDFLKRKINKLLIPFLTFYFLIAIVMSYIYSLYFHNNISILSLNYMFSFYNENFNNMSNAIWFLLCLFEVNVIFYLISIISNMLHYEDAFICIFSLLLGGFGYMMGVLNVNLPMWIDTSFSVIPFFCFGYFLKHKTDFLYPNKYDRYNVLIILVCCVIVFVFGGKVSYIHNIYSIPFFSVYICGIFGALAVLLFSKIFGYIPLLSYLGKYSIIVLIVHHPFVKLFNDFLFWRWAWLYNNTFIKFLIVMLITTCLVPFMKRYAPYVTAQKDLIT